MRSPKLFERMVTLTDKLPLNNKTLRSNFCILQFAVSWFKACALKVATFEFLLN